MRQKIIDLQQAINLRNLIVDGLVVTNGCFDILTTNHVRYLSHAKSLGQFLLVGLNSDESVRSLKGPRRPINKQEDRAEVLASLECVDAVCIFNEPRAHTFLSSVRPDIWVKGGDYSLSSIDPSERQVLEDCGAEIVFTPKLGGSSTTDLISKIKDTLHELRCA